MEVERDTKSEAKPKCFTAKKVSRNLFALVLAVSLGYVHYEYVSYLFENNRNFSHLSELEREMSFPTEMGFYYSYYKTIVEEKLFMAGINKLMYDRLVEYPKEVNAFNRFNIHPEVIIGAAYRYLEPRLNTSSHRVCHTVDRGAGLEPVLSCVGLGEPVVFYLEAIWWLAGVTVAGVFLCATVLSQSVVGGVLAVAQYFANHAECTRVQWAPNERENFAAPLLLLQACLVSVQLRDKDRRAVFPLQVSVFFLNCLCLLFWQFTQFIFLTQVSIFFIMEQLRIIDLKSLCIFLHSHFCGLHMAVLLLQGNDMLETSLYMAMFISVSVYCLLFSSLRIEVFNRLSLIVEAWLVLLRVCIVVCSSLYLKKVISEFMEVEEDSHIWDILYSKLTNYSYKTFHTMLYTCSDVFDFLPFDTVESLAKTMLIPLVTVSVFMVFNRWVTDALRSKDQIKNRLGKETKKVKSDAKDEETDDSGIENNADGKVQDDRKDLDVIEKKLKSKFKDRALEYDGTDSLICFVKSLQIDPAVFYNVAQMLVYGVMAGLVMRLKLLLVPHMCIVGSLAVNRNYYVFPKSVMRCVPLVWLLFLLYFVQELKRNIDTEMSYIGEFSDVPREQLLQWVSRGTEAGAAFAGSMPVLAAVMLSARRRIVAHPHYEHRDARQRAYAVYKMYGRFAPSELYHELNKLRATHLILEHKYCYGKSSRGCTFEQIWDVEAPQLRRRPPLCRALLAVASGADTGTEAGLDHFYPVFSNEHYSVFRVHDLSVRYMPRSFDT